MATSLLSYSKIDINYSHEHAIQKTLLTSLRNCLDKKPFKKRTLTRKININVYYPKLKKIINKLRLFPEDINYILDEYLTDKIIITYVAVISLEFNDSIGGIIEYKASGYINCKKITFKYRQPVSIYSKSMLLGYYSSWGDNQMSFLNETSTNTEFEKCSVDDHIEFIHFYMETYYNKEKYLNDNDEYGYRYGYYEKNNIFYGKQTIYDDETNKIITYNLTRTITDEHHLVVSAKIIRKLNKILHKICKEIQSMLKNA